MSVFGLAGSELRARDGTERQRVPGDAPLPDKRGRKHFEDGSVEICQNYFSFSFSYKILRLRATGQGRGR